ncbi:ankyrin repeat domain-containing protein 1-like [Lingula anatina]|uniref:Ankyrin repeat domain-containing protein 1-like n=1 Tax=Lingula anatina TaxID=7574 RepID=A0A1S3K525_LINAN|nr:ankyrin repeat domain-containing protein 1-like [Lingula anatina]|eukprot:XP_013417730.1 ankyrin repeat domain-containing protein 1-like [Lingula anatina]
MDVQQKIEDIETASLFSSLSTSSTEARLKAKAKRMAIEAELASFEVKKHLDEQELKLKQQREKLKLDTERAKLLAEETAYAEAEMETSAPISSTKLDIQVNSTNLTQNQSSHDVIHHLVNSIQIPKVEIDKFDGDPLQYWNFIKTFENSTTPLYRAILSNSAKVCQLLIHAGANVNLRILGFNVGGESPLMKCVQLDNKEICEVLINSLCNLNAKTDTRYNALHYAVAYRRYDIAELLLTNRIHMHTASVEGVTPMTIAVDQHNAAMCRILVEFGYNMQKKYKWGETPLQHAIKIHSENCAITLVHMGCKLKRPKEENSYFYLAASEGLFQLMKLLLEINPYYIYEKWILERNLPLSLYQKPELFEWLFAKSSQPASLSALCRSVIRVAIGPYPSTQVQDLPLPKKLQEYLALIEYVNEEMYKKIPLTKKECPFDCPSYCPVTARKCPFLDIEGIDYVDSDEEEEESCAGHGAKDGHLESPKVKSIINSKEKDALKRGGTPRRVSFKT